MRLTLERGERFTLRKHLAVPSQPLCCYILLRQCFLSFLAPLPSHLSAITLLVLAVVQHTLLGVLQDQALQAFPFPEVIKAPL